MQTEGRAIQQEIKELINTADSIYRQIREMKAEEITAGIDLLLLKISAWQMRCQKCLDRASERLEYLSGASEKSAGIEKGTADERQILLQGVEAQREKILIQQCIGSAGLEAKNMELLRDVLKNTKMAAEQERLSSHVRRVRSLAGALKRG